MQPTVTQPPPDVTRSDYISFEDYLKQYDSFEGARTEWLAGVVGIYPMTNSFAHNETLRFLTSLFSLFLGITRLGKLALAGVPMKYSDEHPAREPDLMILLTAHLDRITPTCINGIADIVIEIVSPDSIARDHAEKFVEYESAGVPEYWLFDPLRQDAAIWALSAEGSYRRVPLDAQGHLVSSLLPGFALDPAILWRSSLPDGVELIEMAQAMAAR